MRGKVKRERAPRARMAAMAVGGVFFVGVDGSLHGDDGGDSADAGTYGQQRGELRSEVEGAAQPGHEGEGEGEGDKDEDERDAAELEDVAEDEAGAEEDDAGFEPELVGGYARAKDLWQADGVGDEDAKRMAQSTYSILGKVMWWALV